MKDCFRHEIDYIKLKNTKTSKYFHIKGWCFKKFKNTSLTFKAKVNNKEVPFDFVPIQRMDIFKKYQEELNTNNIGFYIQVDCKDYEINSFELIVLDDEGNQSILTKLNDVQITKVEDKCSIEYTIDKIEMDRSKNMASISGWAYSIDQEELSIKILDKSNNEVESTLRIMNRTDLVNLHFINDEQKSCGFHITFVLNNQKKFNIMFETQNDKLVVDINDTTSSKLGLIKAYATNINKDNVRKGMRYLKRNGLKGFINRLKYGVNENGSSYADWFMAHKISDADLEIQRKTKFKYAPKISIIVATFNTKENYLKEMIDTVLNQSYSNWELCIADGSSNDAVIRYIQDKYSDDRIKFTKLDDNYGISGNMNKALELATGDYVALYDHDDMLELDCLFEVVSSLQEFQYDIVYTDEDKFDDNAKEYVDPNFKPDYSVDLFRSHNYITHFFCVNKKIIDEVGGMRSEFDGSQDYDFMFRCIEKANGVHHVAKILYHWRMHPLSTAQNPESKMYCYEAGKRAIEEHYKRTGVKATVEMMPKPYYGLYHTVYSTLDNPLVSILIPNMNHKKVLKTCIDSLYKVNAYQNFEIIIIENNSTEQEIFDYYEELKRNHSNIKVVTWTGEFNYSAINNFGAKYASGDYLLLLNNDTEVITKDALSEMLGCCMRPEVGAVGAKLLYADNTVQHAGVVIGFSGYAGHVFNGITKDEYGFMMRAIINGNYSSVTAACMMVKTSVFNEVEGFDEEFKVACNDVDLCLKIRSKDYLIVYNAFSLWHHYESKSRGYDDNNKEKMWRFNQEVERFQDKWSDILNEGDPYYNKNFKIEYGPFTLG